MQKRTLWSSWAQNLHRWGLNEPVAAFMESSGPLTIYLAQVIYFGQPFLGLLMSPDRWEALAGLFEDQEQSRSFIQLLRQEENS
jgi:hypothetical protein